MVRSLWHSPYPIVASDNLWAARPVGAHKRILFLDYVKDDPNEVLRIARGVDYVRYQEVYYKVNLSDIDSIDFDDGYNVRLIDGTEFAFDNEELFNLIINNMK